jgi:serine/threonine protein kinase
MDVITINDNMYSIDKNKLLGQGAFSDVYSASDINGNSVAVKIVKIANNDAMNRTQLEINIMSDLFHDNIVKYKGSVLINNQYFIILEQCLYGTLHDVEEYHTKSIQNQQQLNLELNTHYYMYQLKQAIEYVYKKNILHRDLKQTNILLYLDPNIIHDNFDEIYHRKNKLIIKLADFGLAKQYIDINDIGPNETICGTPATMSPEILNDGVPTETSDLWSFGVILFQLLTGKHPFEASTLVKLKKKVHMGQQINNSMLHISNKCVNLLDRTLVDYVNRITWSDFFAHDWFEIWKDSGNLSDSTILKVKPIHIPVANFNQSKLPASCLSRVPMTNNIVNYRGNTYLGFNKQSDDIQYALDSHYKKSPRSVSGSTRRTRKFLDNSDSILDNDTISNTI